MTIEKRVNLDNNIYYIVVEVKYKFDNIRTRLCLENYLDDYYDGGDFSILVEKIEKNYNKDKASCYDKEIGFMADILYIYDRVPFLTGIREVCVNSNSYISKEEIADYINMHNLKLESKIDFKLFDENTWKV